MTQEINLNHLALYELVKDSGNLPDNDWENYKKLVVGLLRVKELYFFESELLEKHKEKTMDDLLQKYPHKFVPAGKRNKHFKEYSIIDYVNKHEEVAKVREALGGWKPEDYENTWFDLSLEKLYIMPDDPFYDEFLIYVLRNLDLTDIDEFLTYQFNTYFEADILRFSRLVRLALRKNGNRLMTPEHIETVKESLDILEKNKLAAETEPENGKAKKSKLAREHGDNLTVLNLIQTAYFAGLMKQVKVILKDEKLLPDNRAGEAFQTLTGFSENTLRLRMNLKGQSEVSYTDRKAVRDILHTMLNIVNREIDEQRGNNKDKP